MVDFGGWDMPLHYGSQLDEHHQVRNDAGMFDVSHMRVVDLKGTGVRDFLRYLLANNVDKLQSPGKALYSCLLRQDGGIIDDLIVYFMNESWFRIVSPQEPPTKISPDERTGLRTCPAPVTPRNDLAMIAVQGPNAATKLWAACLDHKNLRRTQTFQRCRIGCVLYRTNWKYRRRWIRDHTPLYGSLCFMASLA